MKHVASSARPKPCKDCPSGSRRAAPHPGPRCTSYHREVVRARKLAAAEARDLTVYGLTPVDRARIMEIQDGRCAICRQATGKIRRLAVDHDHHLEQTVGRRASVRGLLCMPCNRFLGRLGDRADVLVAYLADPPARRVLG